MPPANGGPGTGRGADMFLRVTTKRAGHVKGESVAPDHVDDIQVVGWSWGLNASSAMGTTQATSRRSWTALTVYKNVDRSTTGLMAALATNDEVKEAKLSLRRAGSGQQDFLTITLEKARVVKVEHEAGEDGSVIETLGFAFTEVTVEYRQQQGSGLVGGGYSFSDEMVPN